MESSSVPYFRTHLNVGVGGVVVGDVVTVVVPEVVWEEVCEVVWVVEVVGVVVALVVAVVVAEVVTDVVCDAVGVVASQSLKPPLIHASVSSFSTDAVASQSELSKRRNPNAQLTFSFVPSGPLNSRIAALIAEAVSSH